MLPKLYIIATPIGNLDDLTLRAKKYFQNLKHFFAEDTREFQKLLGLLELNKSEIKIHSYATHNLDEATEKAIQILKEGESIGLVTDRGTPLISDPGSRLVRRAFEEGISVVPIPGVSSLTAALSVSGFSGGKFSFVGFLPEKNKDREAIWKKVETNEWPLVFFEAPQRVAETLAELKIRFPEGRVFLARELTKVHETLQWVVLKELEKTPITFLGEFVGILEPGSKPIPENALELEVQFRSMTDREWSKVIAKRYALAASDVYNALQQHKK